MDCDKFECRKKDFCPDGYKCDDKCQSYEDCSHCLYEDDDIECPLANAFEHSRD